MATEKKCVGGVRPCDSLETLMAHVILFTCPYCMAQTAFLDGVWDLNCSRCGKQTWRGDYETPTARPSA